jgi:TRAP transporter 4TM/12TM fusion protein
MTTPLVRLEFGRPNLLNEVARAIFVPVALCAVLYHVVSVFMTLEGAMQHYTVHLGLILTIVALHGLGEQKNAAGFGRLLWTGLLLIALIASLISTPLLYFMADELELSQPFITTFQFVLGLLLLIAVFIENWSVWGAALTIVSLTAALYFGFGDLLPFHVVDLNFSPTLVISYLSGMGSPRGLFTYIPLSADTLFLLLVYGGLMTSTHVLEMFNELGKLIGNVLRGGVAFSCITASTLIGMVTGQTVSCIALSGSMTIPTMHKGGFTREEAGAIEVMAANGSQIIPPVMGLGAFLMAVTLGISYTEVAAAAILPAFLYMVTLGIGVFALVQASPRIPYERQKIDWRLFLWVLPSFVPSIALVIVLLAQQYSANLAALWGIVVLVGGSVLRPKDLRPKFSSLITGFGDGALAGAQLGIILAAIGIIVQVLVTTGIATLLGRVMIDISGDSKDIALLLGMGIALLLGMGLPTPAAYSLCAIVMIPSLIDVGVDKLVAHFFGFYFAVYSAFTPPVAVGALMASRISQGSFWGTCVECMKLGLVCLVLPFFMVAYPNSLGFPHFTEQTLFASAMLIVSTVLLSASVFGGLIGPLSRNERIVLAIGPVASLFYYSQRVELFAWCAPVLLIGFFVYRFAYSRAPTLWAHKFIK